MNRQNYSKKQIMEKMKLCFEELELWIMEEDDLEDLSVVTSELDFGDFSTRIHAALFKKHDVIEIEINFLPPINENKLLKVYDLINLMNATMMDIGTFSIFPMESAPSLRTALYVPHNCFDSKQFKKTLKRLLSQASHFQELIGRAILEDVSAKEISIDFFNNAKKFYNKGEKNDKN